MRKRILIYLVLAMAIFAGGHALCQDTAIVPIRLVIPITPMEMICDTQEASWDNMTAADFLTIVTEDAGPLSRLMKIYPGNSNLTVGLSYVRTPLLGPGPGRDDLVAIETTPGEFMDVLSGWANRVAANVTSPQILITEPSQCYFNVIFSFIEGFDTGEYQSTMTWTLEIVV